MNSKIEDIKNNLLNNGKVVLELRVLPRAKKTEFVEIMDNGVWKIRLQAVPDKGRANKELINFLAEFFGVSKSFIRVISGDKSRLKIIEINQD